MGRRLALDLARRGMDLVLAARNHEALDSVADELREMGSTVCIKPTDVTDHAQCESLIETAIDTFREINFLILNAGLSMWVRFDQISDISLFRTMMEINYMGAVNCIYAALPYLKESHGKIVAISSAQAVLGMPNHTAYTASKHALKGFLESLELEVGDAIHILNVMPGWIRGTNLRSNALKGDGTPIGWARKHNRQAVSLEKCSAQIVRAMQSDCKELYIPSKLRFLAWLKLIAPQLVKARIKRAVRKQDEGEK